MAVSFFFCSGEEGLEVIVTGDFGGDGGFVDGVGVEAEGGLVLLK